MSKVIVQTGVTFTYAVNMDEVAAGEVKIPDEIRAKASVVLEALREAFPTAGIRAEFWPMVTGNTDCEEIL